MRVADRCVAPRRAVHEVVFADANWWKGSRDGGARHDRVDGGAGGETNRSAPKIRSNDMHRDHSIFEAWKGKVAFEQLSQIGRIARSSDSFRVLPRPQRASS